MLNEDYRPAIVAIAVIYVVALIGVEDLLTTRWSAARALIRESVWLAQRQDQGVGMLRTWTRPSAITACSDQQ
jgi:hypothetical protein